MKVFLSWSGSRSHKVALAFRDWLPSVIQTIEPYVSSEDIDKGARWSSDIAGELEDSSFGILCVTQDNLTAPWLTFEAGALSKTLDKSFVCPFLFDIKRSEVDGPILQFQSTTFERDDLKKLVGTLNKASGNTGLPTARLNKSFEVWYPTLEGALSEIKDSGPKSTQTESEEEAPDGREILEEILELSRLNQKLLRNPENPLADRVAKLTRLIDETLLPRDPRRYLFSERELPQLRPGDFDELVHLSLSGKNPYVGVQIALAMLRDPLPWVYDAGLEVIRIFKSRRSRADKEEALETFERVLDFSFRHPQIRKSSVGSDYYRELTHIVRSALMRTIRR